MINISKHLEHILNSIPELPGIYKMLDSKGNIIYIGKSICLKKRVKSYFVDTPKWEKVHFIFRNHVTTRRYGCYIR